MKKTISALFTIALLLTSINFINAATNYEKDSLVPCGGQGGNSNLCTLCHFMELAERVFTFLLAVSFITALLFVAGSGIGYIVTGGSKGMETAKQALTYALIGFGICLLSWVLVNIVILALGYKPEGGGSDWSKVTLNCEDYLIRSTDVGPGPGGSGSPDPGGSSSPVPSGPWPSGGVKGCTEAVKQAEQGNASGVDPRVLDAIIRCGEGCDSRVSTDGHGSCGYSQALPKIRTWCGITGTPQETCAKIQADPQLDVNCAAKLIADNQKRCGSDIRNVASAYNSGKCNNCAKTTNHYCDRVEKCYNGQK